MDVLSNFLSELKAADFSRAMLSLSTLCLHINSLWPSDTIWRHKSGSTLAQSIAWCLTAPSHHLNQCWLIISKVLWHSSEGIIMIPISKSSLKNSFLGSHWDLPGGNELKLKHMDIIVWEKTIGSKLNTLGQYSTLILCIRLLPTYNSHLTFYSEYKTAIFDYILNP